MHTLRINTCLIIVVFSAVTIVRSQHDENYGDFNEFAGNIFGGREGFNPFDGAAFSRRIQEEISGNIAKMNKQLHEQLAPVRALQIRAQMAGGAGGTTVIKYGDSEVRFVINGVRYVCPSNKIQRDEYKAPECTETLVPDDYNNPCPLGSGYSRVNNMYCFGQHTSLYCKNDVCECVNGRSYTLDQMRQLCGSNFDSYTYVRYEYYPKTTDPYSVKLPTASDVNFCENNDNWHCVWHASAFSI